jgi:hypothetical protein
VQAWELVQLSLDAAQQYITFLGQLPPNNQNMLLFLGMLAREMQAHVDKNLMTYANLGVVWAPCLFRHPEVDLLSNEKLVASSRAEAHFVQCMLQVLPDAMFTMPRKQLEATATSRSPPSIGSTSVRAAVPASTSTSTSTSNNSGAGAGTSSGSGSAPASIIPEGVSSSASSAAVLTPVGPSLEVTSTPAGAPSPEAEPQGL